MLDENRQGFRDRRDRRLVPMIVMGMGDDNRIDVDNFSRENGNATSGLRSSLRAVLEIPASAFVRQHRVNQEFFTCVFNNLCSIADMGDVHVSVPLWGNLTNIVLSTSLAQYGRLGNDRWNRANLRRLPIAAGYVVLKVKLSTGMAG